MDDTTLKIDSPEFSYDDRTILGDWIAISTLNAMGLGSSHLKSVMPASRELVDQLIASDGVVIFSKTYCPYCKMAKEVFDKINHKYTAIELDSRDDADEIQTILGEMTGARTVPRVFVKGVCLGGGSDVKKLYETGELVKKL